MKKSGIDSYGSALAREKSLKAIKELLFDAGARKLYIKRLAPNDNSKNQIYLGGDFSSLNIIPVKSLEVFTSSSGKDRLKQGEKLIRGEIKFIWIDPTGQQHDAPGAKLILYPQYPEVRFSGYLKGSSISASEWMDVNKQGRSHGRYLLIGICHDGTCVGYLVTPDSAAEKELSSLYSGKEIAPLTEISISGALPDHRKTLIAELKRIHLASPISGKKLNKSGVPTPYKAVNGAGYTLEAELGISPNGYAEPDFNGWEIKAHSGSVVTLMTPEPNAGLYQTEGIDKFVRSYGYPDRNGVPNRLNFGGVHKVGDRHPLTGLTLSISGYQADSKKIDADGGIILIDDNDNIAAEWHFTKILEHWNRKHAKAAYVPYDAIKDVNSTSYNYADHASLGEGTDFYKLLAAFSSGNAYYDPGIKLVDAHTPHPKIKRRNQFRMRFSKIGDLYESWETVFFK